jgi:hypothetical protein
LDVFPSSRRRQCALARDDFDGIRTTVALRGVGMTTHTADRDHPGGLRVISFKARAKGSLRGFCDIEWPAAGLVLHDLSVHTSHGKSWVGLPAAPIIDSEGKHHIVDGKKQYKPLIAWKDRSRSDEFSRRVIAELLARYPDALDSGEAAS